MFSDDYFVREEVGSMHFQYKGQYIISATNSGLMIIDQHRAHVRILYDRYIGQMSKQENVSQGLLFPELLTLPPSDAHVLEQIMDDLHHLGFDVTPIGGGSFSINGLPSGVEGLSPQALLQSMVASACDGGKFDISAYRHRIALSLAKSAAIVAGQVLNQDEMDILMSDLLKSSNPSLTPDGKTIIVLLKQESIQKMFV